MGSTPTSIQNAGHGVRIGSDALKHLQTLLKKEKFSSSFILVDENSLQHCLPRLVSGVKALSDSEVIELESGEKNKTVDVCMNVWRALGDIGADRNSLLINLGGGVITDMGGFIASTYKRGISFVNIPTTLLSMVDASVGGKTGVDLDGLKNQVGTFSLPLEVYIVPEFLRTLPKREMLSGFAEVLKHALIADVEYWNELRDLNIATCDNWESIIARSVAIKSDIVAQDPKENGLRKTLNFGHTVGHAVETYFLENAQTLLHGEAIAIGMICESWLSNMHSGLSSDKLEQITSTISRIFGVTNMDSNAYHRIVELMRHDKKNTAGTINFTLLRDIGEPVINKKSNAAEIIEALDYYRSLQSRSGK